jgi:hypothetical protein
MGRQMGGRLGFMEWNGSEHSEGAYHSFTFFLFYLQHSYTRQGSSVERDHSFGDIISFRDGMDQGQDRLYVYSDNQSVGRTRTQRIPSVLIFNRGMKMREILSRLMCCLRSCETD